MDRSEITADVVRDALNYDPATGIFTWKSAAGHRSVVGARAGAPGANGSWLIGLFGKKYHAGRLAWLYVHGRWPEGNIVPSNGDRGDARIGNLREESRAETQRRGRIRSTNTSGIRGVSWNAESGKWIASFTRDYRRVFVGAFATKEEAGAALESAMASQATDAGTMLPRHPKEVRRQRWAAYDTIRRDPVLVGWDSLEAFLADMGEPPTPEHVLMRVRHSAPIGPGNAEWRLPWRREGDGGAAVKRNHHLGRFGLSDADYKRMLAAQNGVCAICKKPERQAFRGKVKQLCVDHDHATDAPRALLCTSCNAMLGLVGDDPWLLRTAADYLEHHRGADSVVSLPSKEIA